jgi:hypothetical protein
LRVPLFALLKFAVIMLVREIGNRVTELMAILGSASWLVPLVSASWAWRQHGAPIVAVVLLVLSGALLAVGHIRPFGPLACLCFLLAAAILELRYRAPAALASP